MVLTEEEKLERKRERNRRYYERNREKINERKRNKNKEKKECKEEEKIETPVKKETPKKEKRNIVIRRKGGRVRAQVGKDGVKLGDEINKDEKKLKVKKIDVEEEIKPIEENDMKGKVLKIPMEDAWRFFNRFIIR